MTPGGTAVRDAIKNNPISKALNDVADHVKDALKGNGGGSESGDSPSTP